MENKAKILIIAFIIIILGIFISFEIKYSNSNDSQINTSQKRIYIANTSGECATIKFFCEPERQYFFDETGCGCELIFLEEKIFCTPETRQADGCIEIYQPVCGWFSENVQCKKYPCAQTYSNSCFACKDENVLYFTEGECPN